MQRNLLHHGIVLLAGLLLCLHTVIPHVHGSLHPSTLLVAEAGEQTNCVDEGLLRLIKDLLSSDLGEDHLENFTPDLNKDFSVDIALPLPDLTAPFPVLNVGLAEVTSARQVSSYLANLPPDDPVVDLASTRGPPFFA